MGFHESKSKIKWIKNYHFKTKRHGNGDENNLTHSLPPKFIYPSSEAEFSCITCTDHGRTVIVNLGYHTYTSFLQQ